jgi:hypothetical protein
MLPAGRPDSRGWVEDVPEESLDRRGVTAVGVILGGDRGRGFFAAGVAVVSALGFAHRRTNS